MACGKQTSGRLAAAPLLHVGIMPETAKSRARRLRELLDIGDTIIVPGAANALGAILVEEAGFDVVYLTGAGIANTYLARPDVGMVSMVELAAHTRAVSSAVSIPVIVDADTGFGNPVNVFYTVETLERAGAAAIQLEDQSFPKRCGHFADKSVISGPEMVQKVRAACDARTDPDVVIIARTDALAVDGLEQACDRAASYRDAGADVVFIEGPTSVEQIEHIVAKVSGPLVLNLVEGGATPEISQQRMQELGIAIGLYANLPLLASIRGTADVLDHLRMGWHRNGRPPIASWERRQALVGKPWYDELEQRYKVIDDDGSARRVDG